MRPFTPFLMITGAVALAGFASMANASATVDLIWQSTGSDTIGDVTSVRSSSEITFEVVLTAGPNGVSSAGLTIDYSDGLAAGTTELVTFACIPGTALPICLHDGIDSGSQINTMTVVDLGIGLVANASQTIGTVTFRKVANPEGTFEFAIGVVDSRDGIFDGQYPGIDIADTTTFNSAFLINALEKVDVDIKRGRDNNPINLSSGGSLRVAILGSDSLDVADVDVTTLALGPNAAAPSHDFTKPNAFEKHRRDVNGDGLMDLISHYRIGDTGIEPSDARVCLAGKKLDGASFEGCDAIRAGKKAGGPRR
jgi:hypothetical protein